MYVVEGTIQENTFSPTGESWMQKSGPESIDISGKTMQDVLLEIAADYRQYYPYALWVVPSLKLLRVVVDIPCWIIEVKITHASTTEVVHYSVDEMKGILTPTFQEVFPTE